MNISYMKCDMIFNMLVEFIVHDLWDIPVLAEPRLTTYVRDVGTKGKQVSDIWDGP